MRLLKIFLIMGMGAALYSCQGEKQTDVSEHAQEYSAQDTLEKVQTMNDYRYSANIEWNGKNVRYLIERHPVDSLPVIQDEFGMEYKDNVLSLTVLQDDKEIFRKNFYKSSFKAYLEPGFYNHAILEGMAFDKVKGDALCFSASVCYPMSDLYMPMLILVYPDGRYKISKDTVLDNIVESIDSLED